jgi:hypothetical protein
MFHVANFPEVGVRVGALNRTKVPLLLGGDDPVFQNVQEREIRVRILVSNLNLFIAFYVSNLRIKIVAWLFCSVIRKAFENLAGIDVLYSY